MTRASLVGLVTLGLFAALAPGCASRTEVIVAVESDIATLDRITISVSNPAGVAQSATATFGTGPATFVRTLGVTWSSGPLGPYTATATGFSSGTQIVSREAIFEFVQGQTRVIHIDLRASCIGVTCGTGQTCGETGCRSAMLQPDELEPYTGTIASHDASSAGGDAGPGTDAASGTDAGPGHDAGPGNDAFVPPVDAFVGPDSPTCGTEVCNMRDDDCDGTIDEGFNLQTDPMNCGACGAVCMLAHSTADTCSAGHCQIGACDTGFRNCDGVQANGCEDNVMTDVNNCGDCTVRCTGTTRMCCMGVCTATCP